MKIEQIVEKYKKRLLETKNSKEEIKKILKEIDNLKYVNINQEIRQEDKIKILKSILGRQDLKEHKTFATGNEEYLELVKLAIKKYGEGK